MLQGKTGSKAMVTKYAIILRSQLGPKCGILRIRSSEDHLLGILELLGHKSLLAGKTMNEGSSFEFHGKMWTPLGKVECRISGNRGNKIINGELNINHKVYELSGKEQP